MNNLQCFFYTRLAHGAKAVQKSATNVRALCAQCASLQHILTAANATIHVNFNLFAHGIHNGGQGLNAALSAVELTAAVVAHNHGIGTTFNSQASIFNILNAFQNDFAAPAFLDPLHITPVEARIKLLGCPS